MAAAMAASTLPFVNGQNVATAVIVVAVSKPGSSFGNGKQSHFAIQTIAHLGDRVSKTIYTL